MKIAKGIAAITYRGISFLGIGFGIGIISLGLTLPGIGHAQVTNATGTIQGTITDPSGAVVPNAQVTIAEPSTGSKKVVQTTGGGYYSGGSLIPGTYRIHVEAPGFSAAEEQVEVQVGNATNGDIKLGVGSSTTEIQVQSSEVQVDTSQTQIQGVLTQQQIQTLPLNGRNFLDLAQLQPGVQIQDGTNFDPTKNGFSSISFGGRFGRTARIELDGLDISDENVGTTTQNISADSIQEFQVAQSNLDISTSITSSGSVNIVSRSGSNRIHGDGFYNFRDKRAGGANFPGGEDNYLQRNNVGGAVGGAFVPDKAFYFFSAENFTQHLQAPVNLSGTGLDDLGGSYSAPYNEMELLGRFDFNLPFGVKGFVRGSYHNNKDIGGFGGGNNYSPYLNENNTPNVGGGLDFVTGNFSHSVRVGYFKFVNHITNQPAITEDPTYNFTPGINLVIGAYSAGANLLAPQTTIQTNKQFKYDGSWVKGGHTIRYGAGVNHLLGGGFASFFGIQPQVALGYTSYDPTNSPFAGGAGNPSNYIVNPSPGINQAIILGNGQGYDTEIPQFGFPGGGQEDWRFTAYLGDQWKVMPKLTVNYGLRYIRDTGRNDADLPAIPLLDQVGPGLGNKVHQPNSNFGPQAGVAYDLFGRGTTVIRAGAGIYFENNVWNNVLFDRPVRLQQGLFFGDTPVCPQTSVALPGGGNMTTIDNTPNGVPIASICGQPVGNVYQDIATLQTTYQALVTQAGAQANGNYIGNTMAVGPQVNGDQLFNPRYKTPESYQMNIGVQQQIAKNFVVTVDYLRNVGQNFLLGIDENHAGDVRNFNATAANAAVGATVAACGVGSVDAAIAACPGLHPGGGGATIGDFAANGLDSINQSNGGGASTTFAFGGGNSNFGQVSFLEPKGRSIYNALQISATQRSVNPLPYVKSTNITASYTYSHFDGTGSNAMTSAGGSGGDQDFGANALNNNNPGSFWGPTSLDRRQQFSIGLDASIWKGIQFDTIAHLYSSLPLTLSVPSQGAGDIFIDDFNGDGTVGDVLPGTNVGSFMRSVGPHSINNAINAYNQKYVGQLTPAGAAVVNSGALTSAQMVAIGATPQSIPTAPSNQLGNDILRIWDIGLSYPFKLGEALTIQPSVHAFNVLNAANFDAPGALGSTRISGILSGSSGSANNTTAASQEPYRIGLGTGVYSFGAPRQLEFGLKVTF
jgi:Carboxypeptidase regulatory-like domain